MGNIIRKHGELYKTLTDDVLNQCCSVTGFTPEVIRKEHDKFFDVAGDGRLKKEYMEELIGDYMPQVSGKRLKYLTNCIFSAIDTNNDGYIDFLEYLMSIKFFQTESPIEKADFIFRIMDKNGDHLVTRKEIARLLECLEDYHKNSSNSSITSVMSGGVKPAANFVLAKLDEDKSGLIGMSEFVDGWLKDETIRTLFTF
ncbi:unnamed protein product [Adineta ricciae]|uniref:EF-hand domain-containing protein n=1 Tax=Adineta ricciae TaxID=249248 RepID=A0A815KVP9_ADIRI|nr:unnamed protein product [Adineta ricciae]